MDEQTFTKADAARDDILEKAYLDCMAMAEAVTIKLTEIDKNDDGKLVRRIAVQENIFGPKSIVRAVFQRVCDNFDGKGDVKL